MEIFKITCSEIDELYHNTRKTMREINTDMIKKYQTVFHDEDFYSFDNLLAPAYGIIALETFLRLSQHLVQNTLKVKQAIKELLDSDPSSRFLNQVIIYAILLCLISLSSYSIRKKSKRSI